MTELALMGEILARPEADAPRQEYAELLVQRGDPRGEFIKVQLRIAEIHRTQGSRAELAGLTPIQRKLLAAHQAEWGMPVSGLARKSYFYRGFVEKVELDPETFLANAAALYERAPILHVALQPGQAAIRDLCQSPLLERIVSLDFNRCGIGDAGAEAIASSSHLGRLAWLDLRYNQITKKGLEALAASKSLPRLRWLDLNFNDGFYDPADGPDETEGDAIIHYGTSKLAKELEERYGVLPWLHFRPADTMWLPPAPYAFEGI